MLSGMNTGIAIIIAAIVLAVSVLFLFRWELSGPVPLLLDRWTGKVVVCDVQSHDRPLQLNCSPK